MMNDFPGGEKIRALLRESIAVKSALLNDEAALADILSVVRVCDSALAAGNKLLFAGNGGSASDAQHIAAELVGRYEQERPGIAALALTTNLSQLTAIANDYGYGTVFNRQLSAYAVSGDVFFALSTSGNSPNMVNAVKVCSKLGVTSVALTGQEGGELAKCSDYCIFVPSRNAERIQEAHITINHILCALLEDFLVSRAGR